jgi:hypothetical protein
MMLIEHQTFSKRFLEHTYQNSIAKCISLLVYFDCDIDFGKSENEVIVNTFLINVHLKKLRF